MAPLRTQTPTQSSKVVDFALEKHFDEQQHPS